jgi:hypothetical protein
MPTIRSAAVQALARLGAQSSDARSAGIGHPWHVIMVGHSIGSSEIWIEAARYKDVDA